MKRAFVVFGLLLGSIAWSPSPAGAASITFETAVGAVNASGDAVHAIANFTTGAGVVNLSLSNLLANPTSIGQDISDLFFTISTGQTSGSLTTSSGQEITINTATDTATLGGFVSTGWVLQSNFTLGSLTGLHVCVIGCPGSIGPTHTIVGPGPYTNANASFNAGPHDPELIGPVTFTFSVPGVTAASTITNAVFSFGTTAGDNVPGAGGTPRDVSPVPEPASMVLLGSGLAAISAEMRRRKKSRRDTNRA